MFSYNYSNQSPIKLDVSLLSEEKDDSCLTQVSIWIEKKWGYLRGNPGIEKRINITKTIQDKLYVVKYADQPVGMFALLDYSLQESEDKSKKETNVKELSHVYVDERLRGYGVGVRIINIAKEIAKAQRVDLIVLNTLNPALNKFYEKLGAKVICDRQLLGHPTTLLRMK